MHAIYKRSYMTRFSDDAKHKIKDIAKSVRFFQKISNNFPHLKSYRVSAFLAITKSLTLGVVYISMMYVRNYIQIAPSIRINFRKLLAFIYFRLKFLLTGRQSKYIS